MWLNCFMYAVSAVYTTMTHILFFVNYMLSGMISTMLLLKKMQKTFAELIISKYLCAEIFKNLKF